VRVYINKDDCVLIFEYINRAPVTRHVYTPLPFPVAGKWMIVEKRVERILFKNKKALLKLVANFKRNILIMFSKMPMKFYFHSNLQ